MRSTLKKDSDIANSFAINLKNRFEALEHENLENSPNTTFDNFTQSCEEAAKQAMPLKNKIKKRVPWENKDIVEKRRSLHKMAEIKNAEPTANNINNFKSARDTLTAAYEKEQKKYIQEKTEEIINATTNQKSSQAWKAVNEISGRKTTNRAKLRASSQDERLKLWKQHFENLLGKPPSINEVVITPLFENELNIKKGAFTIDELCTVLKNTKSGKSCGLDNIAAEVWKLENFNDTLLQLCNAVYTGHSIDKWRQGCLLPFPKKGDLGNTANYRGITLTSIAAKIYNSMMLKQTKTSC